jgi:hypothetical protein
MIEGGRLEIQQKKSRSYLGEAGAMEGAVKNNHWTYQPEVVLERMQLARICRTGEAPTSAVFPFFRCSVGSVYKQARHAAWYGFSSKP